MIKKKKLIFLLVVLFLLATAFKSFAQDQTNFEIVNLKKYYTDNYYNFKFRLPLFTFSIKNTGQVPIKGFDNWYVSFIDVTNKRIITQYSPNRFNYFRVIEPGFVSPLIDIEIHNVNEKIIKVVGQRPVNFIIKAKVKCELNECVKEKEIVFHPSDYDSLPPWD